MIHDVIRTANPFPYTAKFMFVGVEDDTTQQIRSYTKNITLLGEMIIFSPELENYQFSQPL